MTLNVAVKSDPKQVAKGNYMCEISADGLVLTQKKKQIDVPVGTPARYDGKNKFTLKFEDHTLEVTVAKFGSYQNRLAKAVVGFLKGKHAAPDLADFRLPWYFYGLSLLPLGIPVITLGGALPAAMGAGLMAGCFGIAQQEDWPLPVRILAMLALSVVGYAIVGVLIMASLK